MALIKNLSLGIQVKHDGFQKSMNAAGKTVVGFSNQTKSALHQLQSALERDTVAAKAFGENAQGILNGISAKAAIATGSLSGFAGAKVGSIIPTLGAVGFGVVAVNSRLDKLRGKTKETTAMFGSMREKLIVLKMGFNSLVRGADLSTVIKDIRMLFSTTQSLGNIKPTKLVSFFQSIQDSVAKTIDKVALLPAAITKATAPTARKGLFLYMVADLPFIKSEFSRLGESIKYSIGYGFDASKNAINGGMNSVKSFTTTAISETKKAGTAIKDNLTAGYANLKSSSVSAGASIKSSFLAIGPGIKAIGKDMMSLESNVKRFVGVVTAVNRKWADSMLVVKSTYLVASNVMIAVAKKAEEVARRSAAAMKNFAGNSLTAIKNMVAKASSAVGSFAVSAGKKLGEVGGKLAKAGLVTAGVGIAGAAAGLAAFSVAAVKAGAAAEQTKIAFGTLFGSAAKGAVALQELTHFSDVTPFNTEEVISAGKTLKAFSFSAHELIPTLTKIGDVSAGLGLEIGRITTIYGKARVAGTLYAEDINQFTEAGVPIIEELSKVMGVNSNQVKKMGSEGKISFAILEKAFANMTGPGSQFGGLMEKQSKSLLGVWSTLSAKLYGYLQKIGTGIMETFDLSGALQSVVNFVNAFEQHLPVAIGFFESIKIAFMDMFGAFESSGLVSWVDTIVTAFKYLSFSVRSSFKFLLIGVLIVWEKLLTTFNDLVFFVTDVIPAGFDYLVKNAGDIFTDMYNFAETIFTNLANNIVAIIKNIPDLIRGKVSFSDLWTPLTDGYQRVRKEFEAPIRIKTTGEKELAQMIQDTAAKINKDYDDVFNVLPKAAEKVKIPLGERLTDMFSGLKDGIKNKIGEGVESAKDLKSKATSVIDFLFKPKDGAEKATAKPSYSAALFGSADSAKKINSGSGVAKAKADDDKEKKVKGAIDTTNYHMNKAVGFLEKLANKVTTVLDIP